MHVCMQLGCGLNYSHLLQRRAVVKARQMLYLVVRQLPTTIHKAYINTGTSCGFIAWEIMGVTGLFGLTVSSVSKAIQQDNHFFGVVGWAIGFHCTNSCCGARLSTVCISLSASHFPCVYVYSQHSEARQLLTKIQRESRETGPSQRPIEEKRIRWLLLKCVRAKGSPRSLVKLTWSDRELCMFAKPVTGWYN